ncbi:MAG: lysophospholipid acyltransferase family protein [Syntrophales bacterium]|jgi:lysophospholipid acyltransferase (LPLAT)-like uncharacterized protein|nr:lysophospholipid acyltransferase family protein [Syntrophales bacterium]MDY0043415.1 lysophospholipid acyltransferase family protein [Syntrophales bacterium]
MKKFKNKILESRISVTLIYLILHLYAKTLTFDIKGKEKILAHITRGGRIVICSWHQRFFGGLYLPRNLNRPLAIMISQSSDGSFVAGIAQRIGWITARGSSSRGGREALREMVRHVKKYGIGGHIADGPTGPPCIIKPGIVFLAKLAGAAICPAYIHYSNPWVFNSWDKFMIPKPFSRVLLQFGCLEHIPKRPSSEDLEAVRLHIERKMIEEYGTPGN